MGMTGRLKDEIKKRDPFDSLEQEVFLNLQRTADALARDLHGLFKPLELSPTQYNVLRILRGTGQTGLACREIGDRMVTRDPDMTRLLDRLEKRNLITRARDSSDRRVVTTRITDKGISMLAELDEPIGTLHKAQFSHMNPRDLVSLMQLLEEARNKPGS
jgi:DNA-binding MarR family transcriptional regulator